MAVNRFILLCAIVVAVPLSLWLTYTALAVYHEHLFSEVPPPPPAEITPTLSALAGDGDARLTWSVPSDQLGLVEQWEYEQSDSRAGTAPDKHSTGSSATSYLVAGLTNGETYSFRVRAILKLGTGNVANWSNMVSATPMQAGDVLERMERHQHGMERHQWSMAQQQEEMARQQGEMARRQGEMVQQQGKIADGASSVAAFVAENGKVFRGLADRGIVVLDKLVEASGSTDSGCADCPGNSASQVTHNIHHTTFAFRFAPPWFNADQRSLFTSYVVFPEEAKFQDWIDRGPAESCLRGEEAVLRASVCPDTAFYQKAMGPFLEGLSQCATTEKVQLHLVGFASSTGLKEPLEDESEKKILKDRYDRRIAAEAALCQGDRADDEKGTPSDMFNLLIANERAGNAAAMLEYIVPAKLKDAFAIKVIPWCSHAAMADERGGEDDENPARGLMDRRVEVRLTALPGCLDVDPDNRIDVTD